MIYVLITADKCYGMTVNLTKRHRIGTESLPVTNSPVKE